MAYLVDEAKHPSTFVTEPIPQAVLDAFDPRRLYRPIGGDRWPTNKWTVCKERNVAFVGGGTNGNAAADEGVPVTSWCTLLVDGFPVGVVFKDGFELLDGKDPKTGTRFHLDKMVDVYLYLPAEVYGRKEEIVALLEEARYVNVRGPKLPWVRGVVVELTEALLDTEYRSARHAL